MEVLPIRSWKAFKSISITARSAGEELEIYFTVDVGIRQLDEGSRNVQYKGRSGNSPGAVQAENSLTGYSAHGGLCSDTLCFWSVLLVLILQLRIWGFFGV